jgi:type II secretion system protein N
VAMSDANVSTFRRVLRRVATYGSVFSAVFFLTVYWTFPYHLIAGRLVGEVERALGVKLEMQSLSPHWGLGLRAQDVVIVTSPADGEAMRIDIERFTARLKPIDSLLGGPSVAFDVRSEMGRLSGSAQRTRSQDVGLDVNLAGFSLGHVPGLAERLGVGLLGAVSGNVAVSLPEGRVEEISGVADLRIDEAGIGGGMISGATIPPIDLGDLTPRLVAEAGTLRFEPSLTVSSNDLDAEVSGTLQLRAAFATSRSDLVLRFRPTDAFWDANQMLAGLAQAMLRGAQQSDGFYAYRMSGAIGRPQFQPARN